MEKQFVEISTVSAEVYVLYDVFANKRVSTGKNKKLDDGSWVAESFFYSTDVTVHLRRLMENYKVAKEAGTDLVVRAARSMNIEMLVRILSNLAKTTGLAEEYKVFIDEKGDTELIVFLDVDEINDKVFDLDLGLLSQPLKRVAIINRDAMDTEIANKSLKVNG